MKFTIPQPNFLAALTKGASVAPKSNQAPIVTHVRLTVVEGFLLVASTDLDRFAETKTPVQAEVGGDTTVSASALTALVSRLPKDKDVLVELDDTSLIVKCGRSRSKLATLPADQFPAWIDNDASAVTIEMVAADFLDGFGTPRPMTQANGVAHPGFQGVCAISDAAGLRFAATNRFMGALVTLGIPDAPHFDAVTVPNETVDVALRVFKGEEMVTVSISNTKVEFYNYAHRLGSKLIAEPFPLPQLTGFVTEQTDRVMRVDRQALIEAIERARLGMDSGGARAVVMLIPRGEADLEVKGFNSSGNEVRDSVEVDTTAGFGFAAFDPRLLLTVLGSMQGDIIEMRQTVDGVKHLFSSEKDVGFIGLVAAVMSNAAMAE